jgi:hypothetical protein
LGWCLRLASLLAPRLAWVGLLAVVLGKLMAFEWLLSLVPARVLALALVWLGWRRRRVLGLGLRMVRTRWWWVG